MSDELQAYRQKKHVRKADPEVEPEFQIAPMIDILLVLLVFFMSISSTEVLQSSQAVDLPIAKDAKDKPKVAPGQVIVNVLYNPTNDATTLVVDEKEMMPPDMIPLLKARAQANPLIRVLIRADRQIRYEYMRTLLEAVGNSGIGNVTFSVVDKEGEKKP